MATLGDYMRWLQSEGGTCRNGIGLDREIGMVPNTKLIARSGLSTIYDGADQYEELDEDIIDRFDRQLSVLSPFRSKPRA